VPARLIILVVIAQKTQRTASNIDLYKN